MLVDSPNLGCLTSCVKVDTDSSEHGPKREMVNPTDFKKLQLVVVQHTVVYPFASGTFTVNVLIFLGVPWDSRMEA